MANAISTTANPFLNPQNPLKTSGTTSVSTGGTSGGQQVLGVPYGSGTPSTAVPSGVTIAGTPGTSVGNKSGLVSPTATPSVYQQNLNRYGLSSIPTGYAFNAQGKLLNGSGQEYQAPSSSTTPQYNTSGGSAGSGTGGGQAPAGQMYNGQGQLVPIGNDTTVNAQGQNTPISTNVATGGGTQTNFPSIVGGLASTAATSSPQYQAAQQQYLQASQKLADIQSQAAQQYANIAGSRTNLSEAGGEQGLVQNLAAGQEAAQAGLMQAAQASAAAATGQQGTQQSGLASAAGLVAPQSANILGTYNPLNPSQYTGYGGGSSAQGIASGAQATGNYGLGQTYYSQMAPAYNQAQSILNGDPSTGTTGLMGFLQQNPDINPTNLNAANFANQWLNNQFSSSKYQQLGQYLTELLTTLTPIVGSQGVSNYKSQLVQSMVNPTSSTQSLTEQIQNLMGIAQGKMKATYDTFSNPTTSGIQSSNGTTNTNISGYSGWGAQ